MPEATPGPALELLGLRKSFGGAAVVDGVSLSLAAGEVLALVGENGAGKSTLVNLACGLYRPDQGEVRCGGERLLPGDPRAAIAAGIGVVHQHFMLVGPLRVWENVVLGSEPRHRGLFGALGLIDRSAARAQVAEAAEKSGLQLDVDAPVETIGVAQQQRVEIVKQLWRGARVLILDEPTAVLSPKEADELVATARALARSGRSVLFISHKLREVMAVADRVAVLRRGRLVLETRTSDTTAVALAEAVVGQRVAAEILGKLGVPAPTAAAANEGAIHCGAIHTGAIHAGAVHQGERVLEARDLHCQSDRGKPALRGLSLQIRRGEVLGVAGVDGNGQTELAEVLAGLRAARGSLRLDGREGLARGGWARSAGAARQAGVVHLPEDRHRRALCLPLTVEENLALGHQAEVPYARGPRGMLIDAQGRRRRALELIASYDVRPTDPLARASALSGGNQQKVVAARELSGGAPPRLVVAVQPTRGLDLGATQRVHQALRAARDAGAAVLVVSLDLDELRALADRILVLYDGTAAGEASPTATDEELGRLLLGQAARAAPSQAAEPIHG